jgi:UDP-N-acetyl-D-glucosamine dehydrogenase
VTIYVGVRVSDAKSVVVIGLGFVGLPLAYEAQRHGFRVTGLDVNQFTVDDLNRGLSHVDDISDSQVQQMLANGFQATTDPSALANVDTVVMCVPTPLSKNGGPDLSHVQESAQAMSAYLQHDQLVILESTTYPGTTEEILIPILEESGLKAGVDFHVAFSPERIDPGNASFGIRNTPKVVGGVSEESTLRATRFYQEFVDQVIPAKGVREAELAKLIENTYRHVNIALMNELVKFCHELDIDLWDAIRCAATKPFGFEAFFPGPGVGGHCIPIDPNYLSHRVRTHLGQPFRFIELAQEINDGMPAYVAMRVQHLLNDEGKAVKGAKILLLGITYKANISDQRESPAQDVALALGNLGAQVSFHDPYVESWHVNGTELACVSDLAGALNSADLIILLQAHETYLALNDWDSNVPVLDTRGVLTGPTVTSL